MADRGGVCEASRSVVGGSDVTVDISCDPCKFDGTLSEGIGFCTQCQEYLCTVCLQVHKNSRALRRHNILQGSDLPTSRCQNSSTDDSVFCDFHHKDITKLCVAHNIPLCDVCLVCDHSNCESVTDISQASKTDGHRDKVDAFLCYIKSLTEEFKELEKQNINQKEKITKQKQECFDRITSCRQDIDNLVDKLEKEIRLEVDRAFEENMKTLSNRMTTIEQALQVLDLSSDNIEKAKQVGEQCTFVSLNKLRPTVENTEDRLIDTLKEEQDINITFNIEPMLKDLLSKCTHFGTITVERTDTRRHNVIPGYLKDRSIEKSITVNVKVDRNETECWITGIHVLDIGDTLMYDCFNDTVKLMNSSGQITSSLRLKSNLWDVAGFGTGEAAVTLPEQKKIEIVRIEGRQVKLQKRRGIRTGRMCWGLAYHRDNLYVSCHDNPGNSELTILDKQGHIIRKIPGPVNARCPYYLAVDRVGRMYLSDWGTHTLTCMTLSGRTVYTSTKADTGLNYPMGLLLDRDQNVYSVGTGSENIYIISADGKLYRTLMMEEGMIGPHCLSYRRCDTTLIVGMKRYNIHYCKLNSYTSLVCSWCTIILHNNANTNYKEN